MAPKNKPFIGLVEIQDTAKETTTISLNGDTADLTAGGAGQDGNLYLRNAAGYGTLSINGSNASIYLGGSGQAGIVTISDGKDKFRIVLDGPGGRVMAAGVLRSGSEGQAGGLILSDAAGKDTVQITNVDGVLETTSKLQVEVPGYGVAVLGRSQNSTGVIGYGRTGVSAYSIDKGPDAVALHARCTEGDEFGLAARFDGDVWIRGRIIGESKSGYVLDFAVNDSAEYLSAGDLVAVVGSTDPLVGNIPLARVVKANTAYQTGVIGVVDQHVLPGDPLRFDDEDIASGEHLSVVTHGLFRHVKVDASSGGVHAGDLLVTSPNAGHAMKATDRMQAVGAVIGKALGDLEQGIGGLPVMVTLQ
jgi:hypothetical protein